MKRPILPPWSDIGLWADDKEGRGFRDYYRDPNICDEVVKLREQREEVAGLNRIDDEHDVECTRNMNLQGDIPPKTVTTGHDSANDRRNLGPGDIALNPQSPAEAQNAMIRSGITNSANEENNGRISGLQQMEKGIASCSAASNAQDERVSAEHNNSGYNKQGMKVKGIMDVDWPSLTTNHDKDNVPTDATDKLKQNTIGNVWTERPRRKKFMNLELQKVHYLQCRY